MSLESVRSLLLNDAFAQLDAVAVYDGPVVKDEIEAIVDILLRNGRGETVTDVHAENLDTLINALAGSLLGMETAKRPEEEQKVQNKKLFDAILRGIVEDRDFARLESLNVDAPFARN